MRKFHSVSFVSMMLLLLAGCSRVGELEPVVTGPRTLKAVLESGPDTRTHLSDPDSHGIYYPYWSGNEEIAVYVDGLEAPDKYTLTEGSGTASGVFTGTVQGLEKVALYPYDARVDEGLRGGVLNLNLPSVQPYKEGTFAEGVFPMVAVSNTDELRFKNLCSVLKLSMTGEVAVKSIRFIAHDGWMAVSGKATVRADFPSEPELVMAEDGSNAVTLQCDYIPLDPSKATDFFLVIPPGTYKGGFTLEIQTFRGKVVRSTDADIVFDRSQIRSIPAFECIADGEIDPDDLPYNEIWYTTTDNYRIYLYGELFNRTILSHTYADGKGVVVFDGPVTIVRSGAFNYHSLSSLHLPNSVEIIDDYALEYTSISSFHVPDNLKSVGQFAFEGSYALSRIYGRLASPDEKALIMEDGSLVAYALASAGTDLVLPDGVKRVDRGVFNGVEQLETVTFPESVTRVEEYSFAYCPNLREFRGNTEHVPDGRAFVNEDGNLSALAGKGLVDYVLPSSATSFNQDVFSRNETLHSLTFPKLSFSMIWLTDYFSGSDQLEFFYGPDATDDHHCLIMWGDLLFGVTKILPAVYSVPGGYGIRRTNWNVFNGNKTVEHLTMPDDCATIESYAFADMEKLKSVRLPANLASLGSDTFNNTPNLETVYLRSYSPPSFSEGSVESGLGRDGLVINVPKGFEDMYKNSSYWSPYEKNIRGYVYDDLPELDYYISTDYSRNGAVTCIQKASEGAGIDLVMMGDGFTDIQVADGTYASVMRKMADAFFSEEPYKTLRPLFNVYSVDVVSATEGYGHPGQALSGWFGDGTLVGGNDSRCFDYARGAVGDSRMDDVLIIVAMNSTKYAGTCYMYYANDGDYSRGTSVAYFPIGENEEDMAPLVHHEAGGHGFSKLDDEYAYESNGTIPQSVIDNKVATSAYGWWKNIDFTNDLSLVKWSKFLTDSRYAYDGLGCFEGAGTYWRGAWRPTEDSIMRYNTGGFNAPSREAIWYRAHKLAYGDGWQYDYEEFVRYDAKNRKTSASAAAPSRDNRVEKLKPRLHPPVIVPRRWNDADPASSQEMVPMSIGK